MLLQMTAILQMTDDTDISEEFEPNKTNDDDQEIAIE